MAKSMKQYFIMTANNLTQTTRFSSALSSEAKTMTLI